MASSVRIEKTARTRCAPSEGVRLAQRPERSPEVSDDQLRLLPRREMAALVVLVVVDQLRVRLLGPTARALIELVGERADRDGDGDLLRVEEGELVFPIQAGRGDPGVGQPV